MSQTVIIVQDESILAAEGKEGLKPHIQHTYRIELGEYGDPFARWKDGLGRLKEEAGGLGQARLVLPSSMCQVKSMRLPFARGKELDAMVKREMQESFRSEIMDYAVIHSDPKKGVSVVGAGVEKGVLEQFLDMCRSLGISVGSVASPMEGIQRVLGEQKESREHTAIFLFFEEDSLTSILMEKGQYKYSGRSRLFAEPGTVDFGTEVMRNVSGILQFQAASKGEEKITDLYYAGCQREDFEFGLEELREPDLTVQPFGELNGVRMPAGEQVSDWLLCVGAMMCGLRGRRSMNLAASYESGEGGEAGARIGSLWSILPVAITFALCAVIFAVVQVRNLTLEHKLHETEQWMEEMEASKQYQQASDCEQQALQIDETVQEIKQLQENLSTYPGFDTGTLSAIEGAGSGISLKIRTYDADSGSLTFDANSQDVIDIPEYIMNLESTGLFYMVDYTGYTYQDGIYTLSLVCVMDSPQTGGTE